MTCFIAPLAIAADGPFFTALPRGISIGLRGIDEAIDVGHWSGAELGQMDAKEARRHS